ncbi:hypothetical protein MCETE7_00101 [Acidimicrobiia bacterium]
MEAGDAIEVGCLSIRLALFVILAIVGFLAVLVVFPIILLIFLAIPLMFL